MSTFDFAQVSNSTCYLILSSCLDLSPILFQPLPLPLSPSPLFCVFMLRRRRAPILAEIVGSGENARFFKGTRQAQGYEICLANDCKDFCWSDKGTNDTHKSSISPLNKALKITTTARPDRNLCSITSFAWMKEIHTATCIGPFRRRGGFLFSVMNYDWCNHYCYTVSVVESYIRWQTEQSVCIHNIS